MQNAVLFGGCVVGGPKSTAECAGIAEPAAPTDLMDGTACCPQEFGGMAEPDLDQVLVRRAAEDGFKLADQLRPR